MPIKTQDEYNSAIITLKKWSMAYYTEDNPIATDYEYDTLLNDAIAYEKTNDIEPALDSPTNKVGDKISPMFTKDNHIQRLYSMDNVYNIEELRAWLSGKTQRYPGIKYRCEPKFDGMSINIVYEHGVLQKAITRGDGITGEIVTDNAIQVGNIPTTIHDNGLVEIRGEICMDKDTLKSINTKRKKDGKKLLANTRNAAAGAMRQKDHGIVKQSKLTFIPWGVGYSETNHLSQDDIMDYIETLGFRYTYDTITTDNIDDIHDYYMSMMDNRKASPIEMDGIVIKVSDTSIQKQLGHTLKSPRFMIALKFPPIEQVTTVNNIINTIGRTGAITPVAEIDEVTISGVLVKKVTLHNYDHIQKLGLKLGDKVIVVRSGDVIPKITKILYDRRDGAEIDIIKPDRCPYCNTTLVSDETMLMCTNNKCSGSLLSRIAYFVSRQCMDIQGVGKSTIKNLIDANLVKTPLDLYKLTPNDIVTRLRVPSLMAARIVDSIHSSRGVKLERLITALSIPRVSMKVSQTLVSTFGDKALSLDDGDIDKLNDTLSLQVASNYYTYISGHREYIADLIREVRPIS